MRTWPCRLIRASNMLLYTKLAPAKVPKRRSRAGCTFCKDKKKKCDERRPQCARCTEKGLQCTYEAVKPRQRKKRYSPSGLAGHRQDEDEPTLEDDQWQEDAVEQGSDSGCLSPIEAKIDNKSLMRFSKTSDIALSPASVSSIVYDCDIANDGGQKRDVVRKDSSISVASQARSLQPDLAMIAPCPVGSPTLEFCLPVFSEFSDRANRRALVDHFCNVLSHLIVFREESGNPFQQLVLPLSHQSSPVMNAIYALSSAHLEYRGVENTEKSLYFHNQAIQGLARLIERDGKIHKVEILAAIMLLVYYEVLVQRGRSNIVDGHLKGALTIMSSYQESSPAGLFLERAFRFYDVITALSLGTAPLSTAPAAGCLTPFPPLDAPPASPLSNVDTLLGMATTLWPIMHRLSNLLSVRNDIEQATRENQISKIAVLRTEFETTSQSIEAALAQWEPYLPPELVIRDDDTRENAEGKEVPEQRRRLKSILHNALAYRHSAFVYLYRTIYGYAPSHELVQRHAHLALLHCVETVAHRGPMGALLWPLFVAACEAISAEDRALAQKAFVEIELRQGMTNIEKAWMIIREVWNRLDMSNEVSAEAPETDLWRKVSVEMGVNIVFG
ncbi:hypothetical protein F5B20DRAFT_211695 [Whalleya microplaca]|nr:hypothetical protein F5B20DRAFT_211695 [Whalleya microplaca]